MTRTTRVLEVQSRENDKAVDVLAHIRQYYTDKDYV